MNDNIKDYVSESLKIFETHLNIFYAPMKPVTDGKIYINTLDTNISLMSIGARFEKIRSTKFLGIFK
ncbi:MAG TPA: hypothetical protein VF810_05105 [Patescibacteria group bacterium]